jgi:hypothetical protein
MTTMQWRNWRHQHCCIKALAADATSAAAAAAVSHDAVCRATDFPQDRNMMKLLNLPVWIGPWTPVSNGHLCLTLWSAGLESARCRRRLLCIRLHCIEVVELRALRVPRHGVVSLRSATRPGERAWPWEGRILCLTSRPVIKCSHCACSLETRRQLVIN